MPEIQFNYKGTSTGSTTESAPGSKAQRGAMDRSVAVSARFGTRPLVRITIFAGVPVVAASAIAVVMNTWPVPPWSSRSKQPTVVIGWIEDRGDGVNVNGTTGPQFRNDLNTTIDVSNSVDCGAESLFSCRSRAAIHNWIRWTNVIDVVVTGRANAIRTPSIDDRGFYGWSVALHVSATDLRSGRELCVYSQQKAGEMSRNALRYDGANFRDALIEWAGDAADRCSNQILQEWRMLADASEGDTPKP